MTKLSRHARILFGLALAVPLSISGAACGDNSPEPEEPGADAGPDGPGPTPDGPLPDGPPQPPTKDLKRIDWRNTRGAPYPTAVVNVPASELYALSDNGFVTRSSCSDQQGCTYSWRDLSGAEQARREGLINVTSSIVSPDGRKALLVALAGPMQGCDDGELLHQVAAGTLQVLDLATSAVTFNLTLRSNVWSSPAFTPGSDWFFAAPIDGNACFASATGHRAVASPNAAPPGLPAGAQFVKMIDLRHWLIFFNHNLGISDPLVAGSFTAIAESPDRYEVTRGWVHAFYGFGELAQEVASVTPQGVRKQSTFRDEDWFAFGSSGRWVRVCQFLSPAGYRDCRVADALAESPARNLRVTITADHPDDAVILAGGAIVFVGPTPENTRAVYRLNLVSGQRELLHAGTGELRMLGDGEAALLVQSGTAWLIDEERDEKVADNVNHVLTNTRLPFAGFQRQDDFAVLALSKDGVTFSLAFLDVKSRKLATVTDKLYFTPRRGLPFFVFDNCGQPWTTRHGGRVVEGLAQTPQQLYFVEQGSPATLWLLPSDLSAPPRRLAELAGNPASCHTPLVSPSGTRVGFVEDFTADVARVVLSTGP